MSEVATNGDSGRLMPISGKEMRRAREEGICVRLSTGIAVTLRPVPLDNLLRRGEIPDFLTGVAAAAVMESGEAASKDILENLREQIELANLIAPLALVSPRISANPQGDDECLLTDFHVAERGEILALSVQPAEALRRFRDRQAASVEPVLDGQDDGDAPE